MASRKLKPILRKSILAFLLGGLLLSPIVAHASNELYDVRDFRFQVESIGEVAPDNTNSVIDVVSGAEVNIDMQFRLTLLKPPLQGQDDAIGEGDRLNISNNAISGNAIEREGQFDISPEIRGFYLWVVPRRVIETKCEIGLAGSGSFMDCSDANNVGRQDNIDQFIPGIPVIQDFTLDRFFVSEAVAQGGTFPIPEKVGTQIEIWAVVGIDIGGADPVMDGPSSKKFYLRVFETQEDLEAADPKAISSPPGVALNTKGPSALDFLLGSILSFVNIIVGALAAIVRWVVWALATLIVIPLLETTLSMDAKAIAGGPILEGWRFVRDIVNMFFILFLIVIGLGTMLRLESYNFRKLLVSLIMMALLVNFSLLIGRIIIEVADVAQFSFLPARVSVGGEGAEGISGVKFLYKQLSTVHITSIADGFGITADASGAIATTFTILFQLALELGVMLTFAALAVFMLIRTVALWILLVLSPLAFALAVLPATKSLSSKWWTNFIKYALFAPIIAFFLRLTLVFYQQGLGIATSWPLFNNTATAGSGPPEDLIQYVNNLGATPGGIDFGQALSLGMVYVMIIALMWAGLIAAKNMGIFGANAIVGLASKGLAAPFALGWKYPVKGMVGLVGRAYSGWVGRKIGEASKRGEKAARRAELLERKLARAKTPEARAKIQEMLEAARARQRQASIASGGWRAASLLNPKVLKEAWAKRRAEKELRDYGPAIGHMQDTFNRIIPTEWAKIGRFKEGEFGKKTYHGLVAERAVVSQEAEELLKGVRTREDAAQILMNALKSGDKDEIFAALKVLQHGNWQDDHMNITGKKFSQIRYLNEITEQMKAKGISEEEITTILDDLKETAEQTGRARAYGYTTMDKDGAVRAANDFSYYEQLKAPELSNELQEIGERFKLAAEESGDKDFVQASEMFLRAGNRAAAGEKFEDILKTEKYGEKDNQTLAFALTERRFMDEANIKFRRGEAVTHAKAQEAALYVDQDPETGWDSEQHLLGKLHAHEQPPNIVESVTARLHQSQARLMEGLGGFRDDFNGKWSLPDLDIAYKTDVEITADAAGDAKKADLLKGQRAKHRVNLQKIINIRGLNKKFFDAVATSKRVFVKEERERFAKQFNFLADPTSKSTNPEVQSLIKEVSKIAVDHKWEKVTVPKPGPEESREEPVIP